MPAPATFVEQRKHPRAQLQLSARIRWHEPLVMCLEVTRTEDVSREGLLVHRNEPCDAPARVWVVCPFDPAASGPAQPETPARIVRVERATGGGCRIALQFAPPPSKWPRPFERERRNSSRTPLALPVLVRLAGTPWPEESMTQDISQTGMRFETSHIYAAGDTVVAKIPWGKWTATGEIAGRVVRVQAMEDGPGPAPLADPKRGASAIFTSVAVQWLHGGMNGAAKGRKTLSAPR